MHRSRYPLACLSLLAALSACGDDDRAGGDGGIDFDADIDTGMADMCGDTRLMSLVYYGTDTPTAIPLTPGQILAIGSLNGCTGTFITDEWILTADHCGVRPGAEFCVGRVAREADACFTVDQAVSHPQSDMALLRVSQPASSVMPEIEPIPVMVEELDSSWFGTIVEASGYGSQEDGGFGEREFTAQPLVDLRGQNLTIDGEGERGVCFGDSGGPVMGVASDGTVRVFGDLSGGDGSCVGRDNYARTDLVVDWIEEYVGPITTPVGGACGSIDATGQCNGSTAFWCEDDVLQRESCAMCAWSPEANGYRCVTEDPCGGVTAEGSCDGNTARWCDRGVLRSRDCAACDQVCGEVAAVGGAYCVTDVCEGLDYLGECRGDVATWCEDGRLRERDCGREGGRCAFINDRVGYFCVR